MFFKGNLIIFIVISFLMLVSAGNAAELHPILIEQLAEVDENTPIPALIMLTEQINLNQLNIQLKDVTRQERHRRIIEACQELTQKSQQPLISKLEKSVEEYQSYWICNAIAIYATPPAIRELANRADIRMIYPKIEIEPIQAIPFKKSKLRDMEPALSVIRAPQCWQRGITGRGRLVANMDSGVDGEHPALADRWRGNIAPPEHCWLDWREEPSETPEDDGQSGHGTHTMGTITGITPTDTVGVAYQAHWIAANTLLLDYQNGAWDDEIIASYQWFADPDSNPATIDDVPDVVNNAWGVLERFGYYDCYDAYWQAMDNCEAAGVILTYSSGNVLPWWEYRIKSPADRATTPTNSFCVGNLNTTIEPWTIHERSGGGLSACTNEYPLNIKPEVCAPGINIRSCIPGGGYDEKQGTSMSVSFVSGIFALMRQVNPNLTVDRAKEIVMETAIDLGEAGEDTVYGWGLIDAYAAVEATYQTLSLFTGTIHDAQTDIPLHGAILTLTDSIYTTTSDQNGQYNLRSPAGTSTLTIERYGYETLVQDSLTIAVQETIAIDFALTPLPGGTLHGTITNAVNDTPLSQAEVRLLDIPLDPVYTDTAGYYEFQNLPPAVYLMQVSKDGFDPQTVEVEIIVDQNSERNLALLQYESFEEDNGGFITGGNMEMWEWGISTNPPAYHGNYLWTTGLDSVYQNGNSWLETGLYTLAISENPYLKVYHWLETTPGQDGGNVQISINNGIDWQLLTPENGYSHSEIEGLGMPGFSGTMDWQPVIFPLSDYLNETVKFRFNFGAVAADSLAGWAIDYLIIDGQPHIIYVEPELVQLAVPNTHLHPNYPNPFNPQTIIPYQIAVTVDVTLSIYDIAGRLIKQWRYEEQPAGSYRVVWRGENEAGQNVSSGVYFYRLTTFHTGALKRVEMTGKMVLLR